MFVELLKITDFIWKSIIHVWPYLLITVPIAVIVNMSGASKHIGKVFNRKPIISIFLATIVGAFSPFCSCSVIPIIASLLIGGVPLAPVMAFWLASPSMDPEIFFLSVSVLGWKLATWRLASAFGMSLLSGLITHYLVKIKWITNEETLKAYSYSSNKKNRFAVKELFSGIKEKLFPQKENLAFAQADYELVKKFRVFSSNPSGTDRLAAILTGINDCCAEIKNYFSSSEKKKAENCGCGGDIKTEEREKKSRLVPEKIGCCDDPLPVKQKEESSSCGCSGNSKKEIVNSRCGCGNDDTEKNNKSFGERLFRETVKATAMVVKFMILAYFLEAIIILYLPANYIQSILGGNHFASIVWAAIIGIPVYTSTMPALALVGGLISKGMIPAAGLAFLISGPTTTVPAMAAVWNLASRKVFLLYVGFTLGFAILSGLLFYAVSLLI